MSFKSSFQDRQSQAADAKAKALEQLRSRPPVDESVVAERIARQAQRDTANAEKAAARTAAAEAQAAEAEAAAAAAAPRSEAEQKAARDARYAARKRRK